MNHQLKNAILVQCAGGMLILAGYGLSLPWKVAPEAVKALEGELAARLKGATEAVEGLRKTLSEVEPRVMPSAEVATILAMLSERATACGFELELTTAGGVQRQEGSALATLELRFRQPYGRVVEFLRSLETIPYAVSVRALALDAPEVPRAEGEPAELEVALTLGVLAGD